jgi:hypothetical protein
LLDQIHAIDEALAEADILLRSTAPGPGVRELIVRHGSLARVVKAWGAAPPHEAQVHAMLECANELVSAARRVCSAAPPFKPSRARMPTARAIAAVRKTAAPVPIKNGDPRTRSTRPPPPRRRGSQPPPSSR